MTTVTPLISAMVDRTRTSYRLMRNARFGSFATEPVSVCLGQCPLCPKSDHFLRPNEMTLSAISRLQPRLMATKRSATRAYRSRV